MKKKQLLAASGKNKTDNHFAVVILAEATLKKPKKTVNGAVVDARYHKEQKLENKAKNVALKNDSRVSELFRSKNRYEPQEKRESRIRADFKYSTTQASNDFLKGKTCAIFIQK